MQNIGLSCQKKKENYSEKWSIKENFKTFGIICSMKDVKHVERMRLRRPFSLDGEAVDFNNQIV